MIPILYEKDETAFVSNGLGRLRDCISCKCVEERNSIYEVDFEYPITGANYDLIKVGRIIGVTHDDRGDIEPFDIVSFTRPINGVVTFHCTHISYRQSYMTVNGSNINSLANAFTMLANAQPSNPFTYQTDKDSTGYLASADGVPKTVRSILGGVEGSILDAYGGEYEWDKWTVILHQNRGQRRDFSIRYGVNMLDYNEDFDSQGTYSSCIPYWTDGATTIVGDRQDSGGSTVTGRGECVPLDVSDKFEGKPTKAQVEAMGLSVMNSNNPMIPSQNIHVEFVRLQDLGYEGLENLLQCRLCDTIKVVFPFYNTTGNFKIVKTVWDVLMDRYESMELGDLSVTLSEALGISNSNTDSSSIPTITEQGTSNNWTYRKWSNGKYEAWCKYEASGMTLNTASAGTYYGSNGNKQIDLPSFSTSVECITASETASHSSGVYIYNVAPTTSNKLSIDYRAHASSTSAICGGYFFIIGTWA